MMKMKEIRDQEQGAGDRSGLAEKLEAGFGIRYEEKFFLFSIGGQGRLVLEI